jgi:uncharacterized protein YbjT (DUF2867 family)
MILVTGASGQVGRHVAAQLHSAGADFVVSGRHPESLGPTAVYADLTDPSTLPAALSGVSKVFFYAVPSGIDGFL